MTSPLHGEDPRFESGQAHSSIAPGAPLVLFSRLSRSIIGVQAWVLSCTRPHCSPLCPPLRIGAAGEFRVRRLPVRPHLRRAATAARSATSAGTDQNPDVRVGAGAAAATSVTVGRAGGAATSSSIIRFAISTGAPVVS